MSDYVKQVEELMKLPQSLCMQCGDCCRFVIFKGGYSYKEIVELSQSKTAEPSQVKGAIDFLSIFEPYESVEEVKRMSAEFVKDVHGRGLINATFFRCKFLEGNKCSIHETRPDLCKKYPVPHEKNLFHPNCGYKKQALENWSKIKDIITKLKNA